MSILEPTERNILIWLCLYFAGLLGAAGYCVRRLWRWGWAR